MCITHSDRPHESDKCDLNYLESRYSRADRLPPSEAFSSLAPSVNYSPYGGQVTLHDVSGGWGQSKLVCELRPEWKPQHAMWHDDRLWVLGVESLDVYDSDLNLQQRVVDSWLAGAHTVAPGGEGQLLLSCSASDAVLVLDSVSLRITDALRMPESIYGTNFPLRRSDSVVDHYITNDLQLTHVNCAWPFRQGVLTSALIPGAIGWFAPDGAFTEFTRGFVGCHGARARVDTGEVYFSDSCMGVIVSLDDNWLIRQRTVVRSSWLHDALHIEGSVFAAAVYDRMVVEFWDTDAKKCLGTIDCAQHGAPQFLAFGSG